MDYEKKYKEAQGWIEKIYPTLQHEQQMEAEAFFPELAESEDERIRKRIIHALHGDVLDMEETNKALAWLERQGEQKPADKVEPFDKYEGLTDFERTLADICIGWIGEELGWKQYIKDNADVLLKIAVEKFNSVQDVPFEQKSAWSEEDDACKLFAISAVEDYYDEKNPLQKVLVDWLKSLKPQNRWKPSDEQMEVLKEATSIVGSKYKSCLNSLYSDLKKLKD